MYYRVAKFMGYGKLSRKKIEDLRIGARIEVAEAKQDPLDFPEACAVLFEMVREINRLRESDLDAAAGLAARLKELASVLGVLQMKPEDFLQAGAEGRVDGAEVDALIQARLTARANKDWAESDRIRDQLTAMGVFFARRFNGLLNPLWELACLRLRSVSPE
ncbi:DALR domain-containing protein [Pseudomonas tolaasii]